MKITCDTIEYEKGFLRLHVIEEHQSYFENNLLKLKSDILVVSINKKESVKTYEQNAFFHAIISKYFSSGYCSDLCYDDMRKRLKIQYGTGIIYMKYNADTLQIEECEKGLSDFPILKSISLYSKKEMSQLIEGTMQEILSSGMDIDKYIFAYNNFFK